MKVRFFSTTFLIISGFLMVSAVRPGEAAGPKRATPVSIRVVPEEVTVWGAQGSQHFMVLAKEADGLERDVTSGTRLSLSRQGKGESDSTGKFVARSAGEVTLTAKYGGRSAQAALHLEETDKPVPF